MSKSLTYQNIIVICFWLQILGGYEIPLPGDITRVCEFNRLSQMLALTVICSKIILPNINDNKVLPPKENELKQALVSYPMPSNPWAKALSPKKESSWRDIKFKIKTLRIAASRKGVNSRDWKRWIGRAKEMMEKLDKLSS